jgi:hypothetical protein
MTMMMMVVVAVAISQEGGKGGGPPRSAVEWSQRPSFGVGGGFVCIRHSLYTQIDSRPYLLVSPW